MIVVLFDPVDGSQPFLHGEEAQRLRRWLLVTTTLGLPLRAIVFSPKLLARMFGLPYFPITPTFPWLGPLGMVPLPSKWHIHFGEPMRFTGDPDEDDTEIEARVDAVRGRRPPAMTSARCVPPPQQPGKAQQHCQKAAETAGMWW